jgi:hypothetical protein
MYGRVLEPLAPLLAPLLTSIIVFATEDRNIDANDMSLLRQVLVEFHEKSTSIDVWMALRPDSPSQSTCFCSDTSVARLDVLRAHADPGRKLASGVSP